MLLLCVQVRVSDVVDVLADLMEERPRPKRGPPAAAGGGVVQEQSRMGWADVRQRLAARFEAPFEDLCVRLPPRDAGMGVFITSGWLSRAIRLHAHLMPLAVPSYW